MTRSDTPEAGDPPGARPNGPDGPNGLETADGTSDSPGPGPLRRRSEEAASAVMRHVRDRVGGAVHQRVSLALQAILLVGTALTVWQGQWLTATVTFAILVVTLLPLVLGRRFEVFVPPEFEALTIVFVFASLFLGEVGGYYVRFWWWDAALHTASGFLLGVLGFLLVFVMNEKEDIEFHMKPGFVALFAFMFAVGMGALWEIFEFAMDSFFGMNMQKSGLVDTMWDLIVDTVGAAVIAVLGYGYLSTAGTHSFLEQWIESFVEANPRFFGRDRG